MGFTLDGCFFSLFLYTDQINNNNDGTISRISKIVESNQLANEYGAKVGKKNSKRRNDTVRGNIVCRGIHVK